MRPCLFALVLILFSANSNAGSPYERACGANDGTSRIAVDARVPADCRGAIERAAQGCSNERRNAMAEERRIVSLDLELARQEGGIRGTAQRRIESYRAGADIFRGNSERCVAGHSQMSGVCKPKIDELNQQVQQHTQDRTRLETAHSALVDRYNAMSRSDPGFPALHREFVESQRGLQEHMRAGQELQLNLHALNRSIAAAESEISASVGCFAHLHQIHVEGADKLVPVLEAGSSSLVALTGSETAEPPAVVQPTTSLAERAREVATENGVSLGLRGLGAVAPGPVGDIARISGFNADKDAGNRVAGILSTGFEVAGRYGGSAALRVVGGALWGIAGNSSPAGQCSDICPSPSTCSRQGCTFRTMSVQANESAIQALSQK